VQIENDDQMEPSFLLVDIREVGCQTKFVAPLSDAEAAVGYVRCNGVFVLGIGGYSEAPARPESFRRLS
jgi:hypothetical protein